MITINAHVVAALFSCAGLLSLAHNASAGPGDPDPTFGTQGRVTTGIHPGTDIGKAVVVQPDGRIVLAGFLHNGSDVAEDMVVLRYNTDGTLDSTFGSGGVVITDFSGDSDRANSVALQSDGKILVGGQAVTGSQANFALVRYNTNGTLDTTFGAGGKVVTALSGPAQINAIAIQSDGKIVVAGQGPGTVAGTLDFAVARYNTNGSLDGTFGSSGVAETDFFSGDDAAFGIAIQSDGKIVAGGSASRADASSPDFALARYNSDGTLDSTFGSGGVVITDFSSAADAIYGIALQSDGKIVAAGSTFIGADNDNFGLARYNVNGTLDTTFGNGGKVITDLNDPTDEAHAVVIQPDGRIIAGGIAGTGRNLNFAVARYTTNGLLDLTFEHDGKTIAAISSSDDVVNALALQPDGKLIAAGEANATEDFALVRYNTGTPGPGRAASARADFNSDELPDYLLFNATTRQSAIWYLQGATFTSGVYGPTLPAGWVIRCAADINLDGRPDYVLFNATTRQTAIWYMSNSTFLRGAYGPTLPAGWVLIAAADANFDGKPDYVLFNPSTRQTAVWFLNNTTYTGGAYGRTLPAGWTLVDADDFNADARTDFLLANPTTRQTAVWYLNGTTLISGSYGPTLPAGWSLQGSADFNRDGKPDYALFNASTRQTAIWYLNGTALVSGAYGPTLPAGWSLVSP